MTPDDIRTQRFSTRLLHGLSPEEVSAFLEDVAEAYARMQDENTMLTARVKALADDAPVGSKREAPAAVAPLPTPAAPAAPIEELRAAVLREVEALLHNAHAQVQEILDGARTREAEILGEAETTKARRQAEADEIVATATVKADALLGAAREQAAELRTEIDRLSESRTQLVDEIRATLDTYGEWLATVDPRGRARGRREPLGVSDTHGNGVAAADESRVG